MNSHEHRQHAIAGFTLIELMIVVVIAAILIAIAVPMYESQIRESRRTEARTAVVDAAAGEERYFTANNAYSQNPTDLGYSSTAYPVTVGSGYYQLSVTATAADPATGVAASFIATATPIVGMGQDLDTQCQQFTVDQTGQQLANSSANGGGTVTTSTCW